MTDDKEYDRDYRWGVGFGLGQNMYYYNYYCAFRVSYSKRKLFCEPELKTATFDFGRFQVSKNPIYQNLYRTPQMVLFVLVTVRAGYSANLSSIRRV